MLCPRCNADLRAARVRGLTLDYCNPCHLVWFDGQELEAYLQLQRSAITSSPPQRPPGPPLATAATCPRCASPQLQPGTWRDVPLARCATCGGMLIDVGAVAAVREKWTAHREAETRRHATENDARERRWSGDWLDDMFFDFGHDILDSLISGLLDFD